MKITLNTKAALLLLIMAFSICSCSKFSDESPDIQEESIKDVQGSWKIVKASRNEAEITTLMDFSKFRLHLNDDKTYSIDGYLPFLVRDKGTWDVDDPQYPFRIIFDEEGSNGPLVSSLNFPVTGGVRQIRLTFSPGCHTNAYTYEFEKVSN